MGDAVAINSALNGADAAYYLVHSMASGGDFRGADLRLATTFGRAAAEAGVGRIVYLGALGDAPDSAHLAVGRRWVPPWEPAVPRWSNSRRGCVRFGGHLLRDAAISDGAAAGNGLSPLGEDPHPADRAHGLTRLLGAVAPSGTRDLPNRRAPT